MCLLLEEKNAGNDYEVGSKYKDLGSDAMECIDHVIVPKQFLVYKPPFDREFWKSMAWAGRVDDDPRQ